MRKQLPADLLEQVKAALAKHPDGLSFADLDKVLQGAASRRTLYRRLNKWISEHSIQAEGARRNRRYFNAKRADPHNVTQMPDIQRAASDSPVNTQGIALSIAGEDVRNTVRRPLADRTPIGYQRNFLERYVPNDSAYLTDTLKSHLQSLGQTPDRERPAGTYARDILDRLLIDLSWSSSRLEGNTYSLLDTRELIERGIAAPGKDAKETQMILNHKSAIELLVDSADEIGVNRYTVTNLHALLADNLLEDPRKAGRLRDVPIAIGASTYVPTAIPQLIEEMLTLLLQLGSVIRDPFEQAFFLLVHIPYLQPFVDVNKRTSRLASNIPLIKRNLVPLSFIDVPQETYIDGLIGVYELNRIELLRDVFVWAYERSTRRYKTVRDSLPEPDPFRLKYRAVLSDIVGEVVRQHLPVTSATLTQLSRQSVSSQDLEHFVQMALAELNELHPGNIARFRIRPSEFQLWASHRSTSA